MKSGSLAGGTGASSARARIGINMASKHTATTLRFMCSSCGWLSDVEIESLPRLCQASNAPGISSIQTPRCRVKAENYDTTKLDCRARLLDALLLGSSSQ